MGSRKCLKRRTSTPLSPLKSRLACGKPTRGGLKIRTGKRPLRRWTRIHTLVQRIWGNEKEDKVEAALKTMQAMGFSDDGGWLSSLLRAKSGDVGKVLDTIQPGKN